MKPEEFILFTDKAPEINKHIIVTNNIDAENAHGEMSHVWLTNIWFKGSKDYEGIVTFDAADRKIIGLTHWKYA